MSSARGVCLLLAVIGCVAGAGGALAQSSQHRTGLLDLGLGAAAKDLPEEAFIDYACGTEGGPPGKALGAFTDFASCAPEATGLHEVAFRYDDEIEYRLLAQGKDNAAEANGGTTVVSYPVFASALFDDQGILRGLRAVTDTRIDLRQRSNAYLMADAIQIRYGKDGWACTDAPPSHGEEALAGIYLNRACSKTTDGMLLYTEAHFFRRAGETVTSRTTGLVNQGQFESSSRLEIREPGAPLDSRGRPL